MSLTLLFHHGWGFDASFWTPLTQILSDMPQAVDDAGYFGATIAPAVTGPCLAITHSFGTMRLLAAPPPGLVGIVAISGFDRFTRAEDCPGVADRVVSRMIGAMAQAPETVLADFHTTLGSTAPTADVNVDRLLADLQIMRDGDFRFVAGALDVPVLSLQGDRDPLLPMPMRETVFAATTGVMRRNHPGAGHLLPREEPAWCADAIRSFIATLP